MTDQRAVTVFGDSHSRYFFQTPHFAGRLGLRPPIPFRIEGRAIPAASVAGFRPKKSKLSVKEEIREALPKVSRLVLAFGQVDLELGYYYRLTVKREEVDVDTYTSWLQEVYGNFLADLDVDRVDVVVKGVNPTALTPKPFAARYISRIVVDDEGSLRERERRVASVVLSEDDQNAMHRSFNRKVRAMTQDLGFRYFDLAAQLLDGGVHGVSVVEPRLEEQYLTGYFDHHLADTVPVRRMHYKAIVDLFGSVE